MLCMLSLDLGLSIRLMIPSAVIHLAKHESYRQFPSSYYATSLDKFMDSQPTLIVEDINNLYKPSVNNVNPLISLKPVTRATDKRE